MTKKSGHTIQIHQWIIRGVVLLAIPIFYATDLLGFSSDSYRVSIFLILAVIAGIGLFLLKSFGRMTYLAVLGFAVFTYLFNMLQYGSLDLPEVFSAFISPYFLIPLLFGVYLFTAPVQKILK